MRKLFLALCLLYSSNALAQSNYNYYTQYTVGSANWQLNNQISVGTNGDGSGAIWASNTAGGSVVSTMTPPAPSQFAYDAGFTVTAGSNNAGNLGTYMILLGATNNAYLGQTTAQGSFYAVQFTPNMTNGSCVVNVSVSKYVNGVSQTFGGGAQGPCQLQTTYHAVFTQNSYIIVYGNGAVSTDFAEIVEFSDPQPIYGHAGFGALNNPAGSGSTSDLEIYPISATVPTAPAGVKTYAAPTRVELRAFGSQDPNGPGIREYWWYRNGTLVAISQDGGFTDAAVQPNTQYSYTVWAMDYDGNYVSAGPYSVTTPSTGAPDPRQTGTRPTGSYWGGMGEQIDTRSGNLNYTYPLVTAQGRGSTVPVVLSYNSQNWRLDPSGYIWDLGEDRYTGFGWTFQIGSVLPYYNDTTNTTDHYEYQDASGAIYRLDQNNSGVWSSKQSVYVWFDSNLNVLHFRDGSFWYMGCVAASAERDAGTYYPTIIEDSNGNQITVAYAAGQASIWADTSSRITSIADARGPAYTFSYTLYSDNAYYLTGIANSIGSGESFTLNYSQPTTLNSPFSQNPQTIPLRTLSSITNSNTNLTTTFIYDPNSGELTQATFPFGGHIRWAYANAVYSQSTVRGVQYRYLEWDTTIGEREFSLALTPNSGNLTASTMLIFDLRAGASKKWIFDANADATEGLVTSQQDGPITGALLRQVNYTWAQDSTGNNYISRTQEISDPGQSYAVTKQRDQTLDQYGNVTQTELYDYSDLTNPAKTYNTSYLNTSTYIGLYIRNRVTSVSVTDKNNVTTNLKQRTYDQYPNGIGATPNAQQQDPAYGTSYTTRGNLYDEALPWGSWSRNYDQTGTPISIAQDVNPNHYVNLTNNSSTDYAAPSVITTAIR